MVRGRDLELMGEEEGERKGLLRSFVGGPGVKLQAPGHSPGECVPKTFLFPNIYAKIQVKGQLFMHDIQS